MGPMFGDVARTLGVEEAMAIPGLRADELAEIGEAERLFHGRSFLGSSDRRGWRPRCRIARACASPRASTGRRPEAVMEGPLREAPFGVDGLARRLRNGMKEAASLRSEPGRDAGWKRRADRQTMTVKRVKLRQSTLKLTRNALITFETAGWNWCYGVIAVPANARRN